MADPNLRAALVDYLAGMIQELQTELAPYEAGVAEAGRRTGGKWVDVTGARIGQIKREIAALENVIKRHSEDWKSGA